MTDKFFKPDAYCECVLLNGTVLGTDGYCNSIELDNEGFVVFNNINEVDDKKDMIITLFVVPVHNIAYIRRVVRDE